MEKVNDKLWPLLQVRNQQRLSEESIQPQLRKLASSFKMKRNLENEYVGNINSFHYAEPYFALMVSSAIGFVTETLRCFVLHSSFGGVTPSKTVTA